MTLKASAGLPQSDAQPFHRTDLCRSENQRPALCFTAEPMLNLRNMIPLAAPPLRLEGDIDFTLGDVEGIKRERVWAKE